jgi:hypothetical protein
MFLLLLLACATEVTHTAACAAFVSCAQARDAQLGLETDVARFVNERYAGLPTECAE